jgi:hypothetical protein
MGLTTARGEAHEPSLAPAITEKGLVLGATVLAPMRDVDGSSELAVDGAEQRILALLAIVYGGKVGARVLDDIRRAAQYWRKGEKTLAAIELALSDLPPLLEEELASHRLSLGERLLAEGVTPRELIKACGLDSTLLDLVKGYNPDQPRVPAGNPAGGQWTSDGDETSPTAPSVILTEYKVIKELPKDAKVVIPPDGAPVRGGDPPTLLIAPSRADYRQVYAAGSAIVSLPPLDQIVHIRAALHQGGTYDFQRDPIRQETQPAYANASNYAVGVLFGGCRISAFGSTKNGRDLCIFQFQ